MKTEERIARLERQIRVLIAVLIAGMGGVCLLAAAQKEKRVVEAEAFHLIDSQGKPRAALITTPEGPMLGFMDEDGRTRAIIGIMKSHGPAITMSDYVGGTQRSRVVLVGGKKTGLSLWGEDGNVVFTTEK